MSSRTATSTSPRPGIPAHDVSGFVRSDELYTIAEAKRRLGLQTWAWRQAKRKGLKTVKIGRAGFVTGAAILEFVARQGES